MEAISTARPETIILLACERAQAIGMELSNGGLAAFHGGLPIMEGDSLLGAIGVSGGSSEQDLDVARYALGPDQAP